MSKHQSLSGYTRVLAAAPESPKEGEEYYDSVIGAYRRYDGTVWRGVILSTTTSTSTTTTSTSSSTTTTSTSTTTTSTSTTTTSTSTSTS